MSVRRVAAVDLRTAVRSRMVRWLTGVFTVLSALGVSLLAVAGVEDATAVDAVGALSLPAVLVVPLAAIVVGYVAVVGERRSGSLKLLLGFPVSRAAVVAGKLAARTATVAMAVLVAFAVSGVLAAVLYGGVPVGRYAAFTLATVALGVAVAGFAVGVSAAVATRGRALAVAVGSYLLLVLFWQPVVAGVHYAATGGLPGAVVPAWYLLLDRLSPVGAYQVLVRAALDTTATASVFAIRPPAASAAPLETQLGGGPIPWYLSDAAAVLVLAAWTVLPVLVGTLRFRGRDL
ncbi:ABC transporter permease [Halobaculum lipolyticum]|uniref:ABC transporter permease n=1 Tax=Halobaculum lipolyticum TaxID=3032001 RepID=A0ABD5WB28_9EURY|nr:ABC transporter permease subunit [Halobaculum sp. DT31]